MLAIVPFLKNTRKKTHCSLKLKESRLEGSRVLNSVQRVW